MLVAEFHPGSLQTLAVVAAVTTLFMMRARAARRRQQAGTAATPAAIVRSHVESLTVSTKDVRRTLVEMHDFARDTQATLDNKLAMLQQLLVAADERIARLEELECAFASREEDEGIPRG